MQVTKPIDLCIYRRFVMMHSMLLEVLVDLMSSKENWVSAIYLPTLL